MNLASYSSVPRLPRGVGSPQLTGARQFARKEFQGFGHRSATHSPLARKPLRILPGSLSSRLGEGWEVQGS